MQNKHPNTIVSILLIFSVFIMQSFMAIVSGLIGRFCNVRIPVDVAIFITIVPYALLLFIYLRGNIKAIKPYFTKIPHYHSILAVIIISIGVTILISEFDNIFKHLFPPTSFIKYVFYNKAVPSLGIVSVIFSILVHPIVKLSFFILVIYNGQLNYHSRTKTIIITSLLLSISEYNPWIYINIFIISFVILWFFDKYKSIIICFIIIIIFHNMNAVLTLLSFKNHCNILTYHYSDKLILQPLWYDAIGILLIVAGILFIRRNTIMKRSE